jgi:hypothetical protein
LIGIILNELFGEKFMSDKIGMALFGIAITSYCLFVLYSGYKDKSLSFKGQDFSLAEKPVFYFLLMFMAAFFAFSGIAGFVSVFMK